MASERVEFRVLGPLSVRSAGEDRTVGSALQRSVLAALLLNANQVLSAERLVGIVWDGNPPEAPRQALNNHVMRLRKALGPVLAERIQTRTPGLVMEVRPGELDVEAFGSLLQQARSAATDQAWSAAGECLREALALWRGEALLDIPSEQLKQEHGEALKALRFQAEQLQIDTDLKLGRYADAAARVAALRTEHPWHERLMAQQVITLYSGGERSKALTAYRSFRDQLAGELGIEPGRQLHALQRAMLQQAGAGDLLTLLLGQLSPGKVAPGESRADDQDPQPAAPVPATASDLAPQTVGAVAGTVREEPGEALRRRWRSTSRMVRTFVVSAVSFGLAAAAVLLGSGDAKPSPAPVPANRAVTLKNASADGRVRYRGRIATDDQILTTTGVDVPVMARTRDGDAVLVALTLTATSAGTVTVKDTAGNTYTMIGDAVDAYWHRTMLFAAFHAKPLDTADQIIATYPQASKYHLAADVFSGVSTAGAQAGASNLYGHNTSAFSTSAAPLACTAGDLLVSVIATNTGPKPRYSADWQALPVLKLSSYQQTTAYRFVTTTEKCAATGSTTAQWEALAVLLHR